MIVGRPSIYSKDLCDSICMRLAEGESLRSICRDDEMPTISTVLLWVVDGRHLEFSEQYAQARYAQGLGDADRIREVVAELMKGTEIEPQRAKVAIDALKWTAERNAAKVYGAKQQFDHVSSDKSMSPKGLQDFYSDVNDK